MPPRSTGSDDTPAIDLFEYLTSVISNLQLEISRSGDRFLIRVPCSSPLGLRLEPLDGQVFAYFQCRSTSWHWPGERTDVHDLFSVYLAARLAAAGLASCSLLDEPHPASHVPGELYARYIVPMQPNRGWYTDDSNGREQLVALINALCDVEGELHSLGGPCNTAEEMKFSVDDDALTTWGSDIAEAFELDGDNEKYEPILYVRANPNWMYYRTATGDRSVAKSWELGLLIGTSVREEAEERQGESGLLIRRGVLENSWKHDDMVYLKSVLADLNYNDSVDVSVIPLEDCLVVASGPHLCMLRADTGKEAYLQEVEKTLRQQDSFLAWARPAIAFGWVTPIDPKRFEQLTYDLLSAEPNVRRVRFVGSTNNADGGRDLLVDMMTPLTRKEIEAGGAQGGNLLVPRRVLVQCKTKRDPNKSIGKSDVLDIRDTIERYEADGYWLFSSSLITAQLVEHLEVLNRRFPYVDWWTRIEIEEALRRSPRLIETHNDTVTRS